MKTVLISAGHSESDPGATGNGYVEAVLAEKMRDRIFNYLINQKVIVFSDGQESENLPLRAAISLAKKVDFAVEIHFNAGPPSASGVEALCNIRNKRHAQELCSAIANIIGIPIRGDKGWKDPSSGQHHRLGFCDAGGIVLEVCFISSVNDMTWYVNRKWEVAESVAKAIYKIANE